MGQAIRLGESRGSWCCPEQGPPIWKPTQHGRDTTAGEQTTATEKIGQLLHEAGETHHRVFRIVDGADDDWASWYADWLVNLSELPSLLGAAPVRSELTYLLVTLDKDYVASQPAEPWEAYYARCIVDHFSSSEA